MILKTLPIIWLLMISWLSVSCSRNEDENIPSQTYKVSIKYSGDVQNWEEDFSVTAISARRAVPTIHGLDIIKTEKISDGEYQFFTAKSHPADHDFSTSEGLKEIVLTSQMTPLGSDYGSLQAKVTVDKGTEQNVFNYMFDRTGAVKYFVIHVK